MQVLHSDSAWAQLHVLQWTQVDANIVTYVSESCTLEVNSSK